MLQLAAFAHQVQVAFVCLISACVVDLKQGTRVSSSTFRGGGVVYTKKVGAGVQRKLAYTGGSTEEAQLDNLSRFYLIQYITA